MKKMVALFMVLVICFSFFGCQGSDTDAKKKTRRSAEASDDSYGDYDDYDDDDDDDGYDDYVTTTTTKTNTNTNSSAGSSSTPKDHGTYYVADGDSYTLNVGDTIVLKCKEAENASDCDIRWTANSFLFTATGAYDNSRACTLKATLPGTAVS
jgi:hypothetical protein